MAAGVVGIEGGVSGELSEAEDLALKKRAVVDRLVLLHTALWERSENLPLTDPNIGLSFRLGVDDEGARTVDLSGGLPSGPVYTIHGGLGELRLGAPNQTGDLVDPMSSGGQVEILSGILTGGQ